MKVLLILLCAFRIFKVIETTLKENKSTNDKYNIIAAIIAVSLWTSSLVWLIKL